MLNEASVRVLQLAEKELGNAVDNYERAKMEFGKMSVEELLKPYGESGELCLNVFARYVTAKDKAKENIEWVQAQLKI